MIVMRAERQRAAVRWITETGGTVQYAFEFDSKGQSIKNPKLPGPEWLRELLGIDFLSSVSRANVEGLCITSNRIARLPRPPHQAWIGSRLAVAEVKFPGEDPQLPATPWIDTERPRGIMERLPTEREPGC